MKTTQEHNERMAKMTFASVYPHYVNKVVSKGRTKEELHQVIKWLTGFDDAKIFELIELLERGGLEAVRVGGGRFSTNSPHRQLPLEQSLPGP